MSDKPDTSDAEWREKLTPEQYHVLREAGTDPGWMVGAISPGRSAALSRARRTRMFRSTRSRSIAKPEYGVAGVPSTIHEPYSGTHAHRS